LRKFTELNRILFSRCRVSRWINRGRTIAARPARMMELRKVSIGIESPVVGKLLRAE
jgi:hypothetical protein